MDKLPDKFDHKPRDRWVPKIPGIDAFLTKGVRLPRLSACDADEFTNMEVTYYNAVGVPINVPLINLMRSGEAFKAEPCLIDWVGTITDRWTMDHALVDQIWSDGLSYDETGPTADPRPYHVSTTTSPHRAGGMTIPQPRYI